jgi:DNA-binding transcriptional regulator LsrR (DeoR family)
MGKYNAVLVRGRVVGTKSESSILTYLKSEKRRGFLSGFDLIEHNFNTIKQLDTYVMGVSDTACESAFVTSNDHTITELHKIFED